MTVNSPQPLGSMSERVQEAFAQAVELDGLPRSAFLTRLREEDAALAKEVESLVRFHGAGNGEGRDRALDQVLDQLLDGGHTHLGLERDRHPTLSLPPSLLGEVVGGCKLERIIGAGGMSAVYSAWQGFPPRRVAVKIVRRERLSAAARRRLRVEAEALARLEHPNIARVYAAGSQLIGSRESDPDSPYIVMELVEGAMTITRWADEKQLNARARIALMSTICDAVEHAHRAGVIHRDIKPGNVIVGIDGTPKVIDFGIASVADSTVTAATEGPMGTLAYMSPEQARGSTIDTRSDVWGLGALLYDLLADRPPFDMRDRSLAQHLDRLLHDPPTHITHAASEARGASFVTTLPAATDAVLRKALATDPDRRYRGAGELGDELRRLIRGETLLARPDSEWDSLARVTRRHRRSLIAATGIALTVVCALVVSLILLNSERTALAHANWSAYLASISAASGMLDRGDASAAHKNLSAAPEFHRDWEWNFLEQRCDQTSWQLQLPRSQQVYGLDYAADGRTLFVAASGHALALDAQTHQERWRVNSGSTDPWWRVRAVADRGAVFLRLVRGLERVDGNGAVLAWVEDPNINDMDVNAAGDRLFTNSPSGAVERDVNTLALLRTIVAVPALTAFPREMCVAPDGSRIVTGDMGGSVTLFDSENGVVAWSWKTPGIPVEIRGVAFSSDGTRVVACGGPHLVVFDAATGAVLWHLAQSGHLYCSPSFTVDANEVLVATWSETVERYDASNGAFIASISGAHSQVWTVVPSPDGTSIAAGCFGARVQVFASNASTDIPALVLDGSAIVSVATSAQKSSASLYAATANGALFAIDRATLAVQRISVDLHVNDVAVAADDTVAVAHDGGVVWLTGDGSVSRSATTSARVHRVGFVSQDKLTAAICADGCEVFFDSASTKEKWMVGDRKTGCSIACDTQDSNVVYIPGGHGGVSVLLNSTSGLQAHPKHMSPEFPITAALSPDRKTLAIGCVMSEGEVSLLDARTFKPRANLPNHRGNVHAVAWSNDGQRIASAAGDDTVRIWHVARECEILTAWRGPCTDLAFDANDALWLACADGRLRVLRAKDR